MTLSSTTSPTQPYPRVKTDSAQLQGEKFQSAQRA
jgi:hypothetical protein